MRSIETRRCDAGWRNYHVVQLATDDAVGWSEYDGHQGTIGVTAVVAKLGPMAVGDRVQDVERVHEWRLVASPMPATQMLRHASGGESGRP